MERKAVHLFSFRTEERNQRSHTSVPHTSFHNFHMDNVIQWSILRRFSVTNVKEGEKEEEEEMGTEVGTKLNMLRIIFTAI